MGLRASDWLVAAAVGITIVALTVVVVRERIDVDEAHRAHAAEDDAGVVASGVGVDLGRGLREVSDLATKVPTVGVGVVRGSPIGVAPGATDVAFLPASGEVPPALGQPLLTAEERADPAVATALDRARDSGDPQLTGPVDVEDATRSLVVAATYGMGATAAPPVTGTERRERLTGWVVALVDVDALAALHTPDGAEVTVVDSATVGAGTTTSGTEEQQVEVGDRRFIVEVQVPTGGASVSAVAFGVVGLVLAAAASALLLSARRRALVAEAAAEDRASQVRLIGEVAPLVQQSLELAEVLPAVAVQLSDHFELAGVSLSSGTARGEQTELFSMGVDPDTSGKAVLQLPEHLRAGDTLRLALQRGGRSVALLQVVAGRDLDVAELESLRALSELVTAALVNAALYASQQQALGRLRELDGLKTVFLGTASHELRTPATAIAGFAGLLTSSWDRFSEEQRLDFVQRIGANARSLSAVVQDLLDFSLLDRGTLRVALQPLDLSAVVAGVVDRLAPAFAEHEVQSDIEPSLEVAGDHTGLERITTNLLSNAVKFSPPGTTIRVAVRAVGSDVLLEVCDQGPGVPAEERERVFTRFYRGTGDAVLQTRGVGIGLSVVSEFVARMHGEVQVDDAPGGGARFTVRIPAATGQPLEEIADATTA